VTGLQDIRRQLSASCSIVACRTASPNSFLRPVVGSASLLSVIANFLEDSNMHPQFHHSPGGIAYSETKGRLMMAPVTAPCAAGRKPSSRACLLLRVLRRPDNLQTALGLCHGCFFPERAPQSSVRRDRCILTREKIDTAQDVYTSPFQNREIQRSIYSPASRRYVLSEERFLFSQTKMCRELAQNGL